MQATITVRAHTYPVVLPSVRDPRLHLAAVITTLQVLGQTVFDFDLSIAQILASILTCAVLDFVIVFAAKQVLAWPASAMLTGNGVAFILRVPGTQHGDWWSTRGLWIFAGTGAVSLLSKYVIRWRGRHVFNPSNFGLVLCFLTLGASRVEPLNFWWGEFGPWLAFALAVIVLGGVAITRRTRMLEMAVAFWLTFAAGIAIVAASGHCMVAQWHVGPICGVDFWWLLVTSPEVLVFLFFMITDPKTAPEGRRARVVFGMGVAVAATLLVAPQRTEYGTKVAVLSALAVLCVFRPLLEARLPTGDWNDRLHPDRATTRRFALGGLAVAIVGVPLIAAAGFHARPSAFADTVPDGARGVARPEVRVEASQIPPIDVGSQSEFANALTRQDVREIAHDLIADLVITAEALKDHDRALAATASAQTWLGNVQRTIDGAAGHGALVVPTYHFDHMTVAVLKLRAAQALPEIDVVVTGLIHRETYVGSRVVSRADAPYRRTFVVAAIGGHYLITADRSGSPH